MLILGLDFETTWTTPVNPCIARPIEVGAVLYDAEARKPVIMQSDFIHSEDLPPSPEELVKLTGITDDDRVNYGDNSETVFKKLNTLLRLADYVLAHNGLEFDKVIYEKECERLSLEPVEKWWLDSKTDLPLPDTIKTSKLTYLAAEHGFANPFSHRALFDVLTMIKICEHYDFKEIVALSKEPNFKLIASVSYHDRQLAKDRGYYWDGENKQWTKVVKESRLEVEKAELKFPVQSIPMSR